MNMRAQLVPLEGGAPVEIVKDMTIVGRGQECDVRVEHKSVSKIHCVIVKTDGLLLVRDLGSTNGTRVNGTRIRRGMLLPNDKLSVANFHFRALFGAALKSAEESEKTQQLDPREVAKIGKVPPPPEDGLKDSSEEIPLMEIRANSLPDVYPDEPKNR